MWEVLECECFGDICPQKVFIGQEFCPQNFLPDRNKALKYHYWTSYQSRLLLTLVLFVYKSVVPAVLMI